VVETFRQGMEIVGESFRDKYCAGYLIFAGEMPDAYIDSFRPFPGYWLLQSHQWDAPWMSLKKQGWGGGGITVGGSAVTEEVCRYAGADAWSKNAGEAVKIFNTWVLVILITPGPPWAVHGNDIGCRCGNDCYYKID
jgi:hypothetical protein